MVVSLLSGGWPVDNVERLAKELVRNWLDNYTLSGARAFRENENKKAAIISEARELGIYDAVFTRATDIMHGAK